MHDLSQLCHAHMDACRRLRHVKHRLAEGSQIERRYLAQRVNAAELGATNDEWQPFKHFRVDRPAMRSQRDCRVCDLAGAVRYRKFRVI